MPRSTMRTTSNSADNVKCSSIVENCALLVYYAASIGNSLPTFRAPYGPILLGCPETLGTNCHYYLRNNPDECNSNPLRGGGLK